MSLDIPSMEQILYAQLSTGHSMIEYIRDRIDDGKFNDEELSKHLDMSLFAMTQAYHRMRTLLKAGEKS